MKKVGLIGGMSWESSALYYERINHLIHERLGGLYSAELMLYSVNFHEIERLQVEQNWNKSATILAQIAKKLEIAGAEAVALCTNTMHIVADQIASPISIPFLHIIDAVANEGRQLGLKKVALLGTKFTMSGQFYTDKLMSAGLEVIIPSEEDQLEVNRIIYDELCQGIILDTSKEIYKNIIQKQIEKGAEGIILGCTELGLIVNASDFTLPVLDTTQIHVQAIVDFILT